MSDIREKKIEDNPNLKISVYFDPLLACTDQTFNTIKNGRFIMDINE
jgi:hypothetical protein